MGAHDILFAILTVADASLMVHLQRRRQRRHRMERMMRSVRVAVQREIATAITTLAA